MRDVHGVLNLLLGAGGARLLALLVDNRVRNAVRHNDQRRVVRVSTGATADRAWLRVENSSAAINAGELQKFTEPLCRNRRAADGGHGLGLAIVHAITRAHAGDLELELRDGGGLIATVSLPIAGAAR